MGEFEKIIISVGSVGQPRDFDPRAGYVIFTDAGIRWRRVKYDVDTASQKIFSNPLLPNSFGVRLLRGI